MPLSVVLSIAIEKHPRRGRTSGLIFDCHRGEILHFVQDDIQTPVVLSIAIAKHPRRGRTSILPLSVVLSKAKDLGVDS